MLITHQLHIKITYLRYDKREVVAASLHRSIEAYERDVSDAGSLLKLYRG
jgi:hypothetical protein